MKSIIKKITSICTVAIAACAISISAPAMVFADDVDANTKAQLQQTVKALSDSIIAMSEEDIAGYKASQDAFTANAMTSWESAKKEVGDRVDADADKAEDIEVSFEDNVYTATYNVDFSEEDASFIYTFDASGTPTNLTVDVKVPMAVNLQRAGLNTVMGLGTVFMVLVFLSFLISCFKYIPNPEQKKAEAAKKAAAEKAAAAPAPVAAVEEDYADDEELVAVIMAAIAASEGTSTDGFVVRSIRKARRAR